MYTVLATYLLPRRDGGPRTHLLLLPSHVLDLLLLGPEQLRIGKVRMSRAVNREHMLPRKAALYL